MTTKVQKWGNSLAVRLPKELAKSLDLKSGTSVRFFKKSNSFEVKVDIPPKKIEYTYKLEELLKGMTKKNLHPETDWGSDVGKEIVAWE